MKRQQLKAWVVFQERSNVLLVVAKRQRRRSEDERDVIEEGSRH